MTATAPRWTPDELAAYKRGKLTPEQRQAEAARPTKADRQAEKALQSQCESALASRGIYYLHLSFRAREKVGHPDLTFSVAGQAYAVELKTATGTVTAQQRAALLQMGDAVNGATARVVRDYDSFIALIGGDETAGETLKQIKGAI